MHHTNNPSQILEEAKRVSQHIIIIEDTYANFFHKWLTQTMDTIVNLGHSKMTYQNKSEKQWEITFKDLGLKVINKDRKRVLLLFRQTYYLLGK